MINNIFLCSFASDDLSRSKKRFLKQASFFYKNTNIKIYDQKDLIENFQKKIKKNLFKENRAFGYGIWKPYIVLDFFKRIPENSVLQYSDIGCHFNSNGKNRFKDYIKFANKYKSLVFEYDGKNLGKNNADLHFQKYFEFQYSKKDLLKYFKYEKNLKILNSPQIWSGSFFLKKTLRNKIILKNWLNVMKKNHLIDGTKSKSPEDLGFGESRWDQSVFSILSKKNKFFKLSTSECEWAENGRRRIWYHLENYPIIARRDLKRDFITRFKNRQQRTFRRYKKLLLSKF